MNHPYIAIKVSTFASYNEPLSNGETDMDMLFLRFQIPFARPPLEDIPVETLLVIGIVGLLILCPCLFFIKYLKDDRLDKGYYHDSLITAHIGLTIVLTIATGVFLRSFDLINKWIEQQPLIVLIYIVLFLSIFGVGIGKLIDCWVYRLKKRSS